MANSVHPDEMAHYEPFHLDIHCLHRYLFWSTGLKGLSLPLKDIGCRIRHLNIQGLINKTDHLS